MSIMEKLGMTEIKFEDIRQGDIIGYSSLSLFLSGVADHIDSYTTYDEWVTEDGLSLASSDVDGIYRFGGDVALNEESAICELLPVTRRGRFPEDGTLVLTETVGEWEEGLIFYTRITGWYLYDPELGNTTEKVDTHLLRELFDEGKLVVTERF